MNIKQGDSVAASNALTSFAGASPAAARNWLRAVFRDVNNKLSVRKGGQ